MKRFFAVLWLFLKIILGFSAAFLLVILFLFVYVISYFSGTAGQGSLAEEGIRCGMVFGAAVHRNSLPGPAIERRVGTAARLYKEGILQHIILSGGKGGEETLSEAYVMSGVAIRDGIPGKDISLEDHSRSTWENLLLSKPLTGSCATVIGISDRYHLARIEFLARAQGWDDLQTLPADWGTPWWFELQSTFREVFALMYYIPVTWLLNVRSDIPYEGFILMPREWILGLLINKSIHLDLSIAYSR